MKSAASSQKQKTGLKNANKFLTLGTVQLGLPYGIANPNGQPSETEAVAILQKARELGINTFDCAQAYGAAEAVLGKGLSEYPEAKIITKLHPNLSNYTETALPMALRQSIAASCQKLRRDHLPVVMLHRWDQRYLENELLWKTLLALQNEGVIGALGASVQNETEAMEALNDVDVKAIQLPINVLDWRWIKAGINSRCKQRADVTVYARSVFLQGVLLSDETIWPKLDVPDYQPSRWIHTLKSLAKTLNRQGAADLCLAYVNGLDWVHSPVMGVETLTQLEENVQLFQQPPLTQAEIEIVRQALGEFPALEVLLNPACWPPKS